VDDRGRYAYADNETQARSAPTTLRQRNTDIIRKLHQYTLNSVLPLLPDPVPACRDEVPAVIGNFPYLFDVGISA
jgi:hypothetical protein